MAFTVNILTAVLNFHLILLFVGKIRMESRKVVYSGNQPW